MEKFSIKVKGGEEVLDTDKILCLKAEGSYTYIYTQVKDTGKFEKYMLCGNLKQYEKRLKVLPWFCRISRSAIINLRYLKFKGRDNYIKLKIKCAEGLRLAKSYKARYKEAMSKMQPPLK